MAGPGSPWIASILPLICETHTRTQTFNMSYVLPLRVLAAAYDEGINIRHPTLPYRKRNNKISISFNVH